MREEIVKRIREAKPEHVKAAQVVLQKCAARAGKALGAGLPTWKVAIDHLHNRPELLKDCSPLLHDVVADALTDAERLDKVNR